MSANDYDEDLIEGLYGDLADDFQTEELIDPDRPMKEEDGAPSGAAQAQPAATNAAPQDVKPNLGQMQQPQQAQPGPSNTNGQQAFGQGQVVGGAGPSAGTGTGAGGDQDGIDRIKPSDMPDEGKMFIGGLNWETTDDGLKEYMAQYGEVDACTIMRDPNGRSRGFAFLTYKNAASVAKVMSMTHHLDGKQIDPKRAIPRAEHERTAKVFVGGLAASVTSESLKAFLGQFGTVMDATVMYDRETDRSKGFAFATFADEQAVEKAMAASGIELEGKPIEIKKAQPRGSGNLPKNFGNNNRFGQNQPGHMGGFGGGGPQGGMGGNNQGGFDPMAMAMMYQNMMKGSGMGGMGMGGGFDPNAMAMMYQNMMKNMGGMGNAPAINPNMAGNMMRAGGPMGGMGGMGMNNMMGGGMGMNAMGGMGGMGGMGMGMGGMGGMGGGYGNNMMNRPMGNNPRQPIPNAPRGPAAMRSTGGGGAAGASGSGGQGADPQGTGAQRYSTQGSQRSRPY